MKCQLADPNHSNTWILFTCFSFHFLTLKPPCQIMMDFPLVDRSLLCTSVLKRQTPTCISNSRTTFYPSCRSAVSKSRLQYGTKASVRVHAREAHSLLWRMHAVFCSSGLFAFAQYSRVLVSSVPTGCWGLWEVTRDLLPKSCNAT